MRWEISNFLPKLALFNTFSIVYKTIAGCYCTRAYRSADFGAPILLLEVHKND